MGSTFGNEMLEPAGIATTRGSNLFSWDAMLAGGLLPGTRRPGIQTTDPSGSILLFAGKRRVTLPDNVAVPPETVWDPAIEAQSAAATPSGARNVFDCMRISPRKNE